MVQGLTPELTLYTVRLALFANQYEDNTGHMSAKHDPDIVEHGLLGDGLMVLVAR